MAHHACPYCGRGFASEAELAEHLSRAFAKHDQSEKKTGIGARLRAAAMRMRANQSDEDGRPIPAPGETLAHMGHKRGRR